MRTVIGIDIGGSTTKIVGFKTDDNGNKTLIKPMFVKATDPITSIYGAFGKFTLENGLELGDIDRVMMTGVGSSFMAKPIYDLVCDPVPEFTAVGLGGLYLSGLDEAIVVNMGTGTTFIHAKRDGDKTIVEHIGGSGVGGGTLVGLSKKMLGVDTIEHIEALCDGGNLSNVDLRVKDITKHRKYSEINEELTASNFGKLSDLANKHDIALGISNMVAETIAMLAVFAAKSYNVKDIVLTGNLTTIAPIHDAFAALKNSFDYNFLFPENTRFATVIGAALSDELK